MSTTAEQVAERLGAHPDELDEDPTMLAITAQVYAGEVARLGPCIGFALTEPHGMIGVFSEYEIEPIGMGDTATEALEDALQRIAPRGETDPRTPSTAPETEVS